MMSGLRPIILSGHHGLTRAIVAELTMLATSKGCELIFQDAPETEKPEDIAKRLILEAPPIRYYAEPFFPRQSAHERANPNQPFYRGIHGKRRQMR